MPRRVIVVGGLGQDGRLALERLGDEGAVAIGIDLGSTCAVNCAWERPVDITDAEQVLGCVAEFQPDEILFFAAFHHSSEDPPMSEGDLHKKSFSVNLFSLLNFLEAMRLRAPAARLFYAASSLVFGGTKTRRQTERTPFEPDTVYGISKLGGLLACRRYRQAYGLFASVGIMYNHESAYRPEKFVSMKVIAGVARILAGSGETIELGDLEAKVDWGYAPDYVDAAFRMLRLAPGGEYVVASGRTRTVGALVRTACALAGLDWRACVRVRSGVLTRKRTPLVGDSTKLRRATGWRPSTKFDAMVKIMLEAEQARIGSAKNA